MNDAQDIVDVLLDLKEVIGQWSRDKKTESHQLTIHRLIREHPEVARSGATGEFGEPPLHYAAFHGSTVALDELLAAGADVNAVWNNKEQYTALHLAAQQGQECACQILVEARASLTQREANGFTPLMEAIYGHHYAAIGQLILLGAPVDLRAAVSLRQVNVVRLLLRDNPGLAHELPDASDLVGEAVAWGKGNTAVLRLLLEAGADPNTYGVMNPPLYHTLRFADQEATELLLAHGADPDREIQPGIPSARVQAETLGKSWALDLFNRAKSKSQGE